MDFFDPKKQKRHAIRLGIGYALLAIALALATTILLYQAYGFGFDKNGKVIQNGLVFFSSQPNGADIYVNGHRYKAQTNTRLTLPAGQYTMQVAKNGYRTWQRAITVDGGSVERFDYPFLFPVTLATATTKQYSAAPALVTESLDRHWLLTSDATPNQFDLYDLSVAKPEAKQLAISTDILAAGTTTTGWRMVQWADDNRHVILARSYQKDSNSGSEYILFDRQDPTQSQNLTVQLGFNPTVLALRNLKYDQYLAYDQPNAQLFTATLKKPTPQPYLQNVLNFATDSNAVLYVTTQDAPAGKVLVRLRQNADQSYTVRQLPASSNYVLDLATYSGTQYVAAGAQNEDKVYVYQDPIGTLQGDAKTVLVPVDILKVAAPTYVAFSNNARFVMAESADRFAVYDAETDKDYAFQAKAALDAPQAHADWMDGFRIDMVAGGKVVVFDFDGANNQTLVAANPNYLPMFDPGYKAMYTMTSQNALSGTSLLVP